MNTSILGMTNMESIIDIQNTTDTTDTANTEKRICNICTEEIDNHKIVKLKCDPLRHIFCIECITDWYKEIKKIIKTGNYYTQRMCPICRNYGGYLPLMDGQLYIKGIHKNVHINTCVKIDPNPSICNQKLKTKDGYCILVGKTEFGGKCGKHKNCV